MTLQERFIAFTKRYLKSVQGPRTLLCLIALCVVTLTAGCYFTAWTLRCPKIDVKLSPRLLPLTALASFPGSGNTWLRHLVQEATGIGTGSVYCDESLRTTSFPFECVRNQSVILIKTHFPVGDNKVMFKRVVVLVRNPFDALRSDFNRLRSNNNHTGQAPKNATARWPGFVRKRAVRWGERHRSWLEYRGPLHVISYEKLKANMKYELKRLFDFLAVPVSNTAISCTIANSEGQHHRQKTKQSILKYDTELTEIVRNEIKKVSEKLPIPY